MSEAVQIDDTVKSNALRLVAGGSSVADVARELGVSPMKVYGWCRETQLLERMREERYVTIIQEYEDPQYSVASILGRHSLSSTELYTLLARYGVPLRAERNEKSAEETDARILQLFDSGVTMADIQRQTGKGYPHIYRLIDRSGRSRRR